MNSRLGIMGGTFDPIHIGHLILAQQAIEQLGLEKVLFITAADPPHKAGDEVTEARHRYNMTALAVQDNNRFECSRIELDRPGYSYTIDTVREIAEQSGQTTSVYLLVGADEAADLMSWREPYEIQKYATIVAANRPGYPPEKALGSLPEDFAKKLLPLAMPGVDVSSTDLRERVRTGRSIRYLVPAAVEKYILDNGLYRGNA